MIIDKEKLWFVKDEDCIMKKASDIVYDLRGQLAIIPREYNLFCGHCGVIYLYFAVIAQILPEIKKYLSQVILVQQTT